MKGHIAKWIGAGIVLGAFFYWQNNGLMLTSMTYRGDVPKAFDGYKILQVADLQNKVFFPKQKALLRKIQKANPDIIVITGDLLDRNRTDVESAMGLIRAAVKIAPIYFVSGNHEHQSGQWEILAEAMTQAGVTILENGKSVIARNGETITLLGLADKKVNPYCQQVLHTLLADRESGLSILLSHRPELFEMYAEEGVDLVFTGHAHGGQIRLPFMGGLFAPHQGFFPRYTEGMFEKDGTVMVVSRGLGNSTFPLRLFNRPELVAVTLRTEQERK